MTPISHVPFRYHAQQTKSRHDANFVVTGGTGGCHNDNHRCHQWRQSWHHDDSVTISGGTSDSKVGIMTVQVVLLMHACR